MELTKEEFVKYLRKVKDAFELDCDINDLSYKKGVEFNTNFALLADPVIELLSVIMNDTENDIQYFVYELNFGEDYFAGCFTNNDDEDIDISNSEKLYDYLKNK